MRNAKICRVLGVIPTIVACAYRNRVGLAYNYPDSENSRGMSYTETLLWMMDAMPGDNYRPHPKLVRALDVLFIVHADHELNCSTAAMRHLASVRTDPLTAVSGASAALYGPLHGGASEAVIHMLEAIGSEEEIPSFLARVKAKKTKLMGFGHRVYKNYDPRAILLKDLANDVFELVGQEDPLVRVARCLEQAALEDEYFTSRKLFPNLDFWSGLIYRAMGIDLPFYPLLFALPRTAGWLAHYVEGINMDDDMMSRKGGDEGTGAGKVTEDGATKGSTYITRPRSIYVGKLRDGESDVDFVVPEYNENYGVDVSKSAIQRRRSLAASTWWFSNE